MKLSNVRDVLKAEVVHGDAQMDMEIGSAAASDLMSDLLRGPTEGVLLLTGLSNVQTIRSSIISGAVAVVLVRNKQPDPEMVEHAREHDLPLMRTPFTMFTACGRLFREGLQGVEVRSKK